jgi:hypothetical protein
LLDIAAQYPRDDNLFFDAYHMNPEGFKLLAWIGLQKFIPQLTLDLRDDKLARRPTISVHHPIVAGDGVEYVPPACEPPPALAASGRALPLASMTPSGNVLLQQSADGVTFRSIPQPASYIGLLPLNIACIDAGGWIAADIRVTHGAVGVGVHNRTGDDFIALQSVPPDNAGRSTFLRLDSFADAGDLVVRNLADGFSDGIVKAVRVIPEAGKTVSRCAQPTAGGQ